MTDTGGLLGPTEIRELAADLGLRPTKQLGQNFVHDPNTVRRIVRLAGVGPEHRVLEIGAGLGSLTLGLLGSGAHVAAVEIEPALVGRLPHTVDRLFPEAGDRLVALEADALRLRADAFSDPPTVLVANLPYNVAVPVVLHVLAEFPTVQHGLVMVQREVADRIVAHPGGRVYGVPSVKTAWYCRTRKVGEVSRSVFWPVPHVDSALVAFERHAEVLDVDRDTVFSLVDAAFAQRRKTLRTALAPWFGSPQRAAELLASAGVDPRSRGEQLGVEQFAAIAAQV